MAAKVTTKANQDSLCIDEIVTFSRKSNKKEVCSYYFPMDILCLDIF